MSRSYDFAATDGLAYAGPRWLMKRYTQGRTEWPIAWCQAIHAPSVDGGVLAAFSLEIFRAKGISAYPAQVLRLQATSSAWRSPRREHRTCHPVTLVQVGRTEVRIYDPGEGVWLDPERREGHGAHVAVRSEAPLALTWGAHTLTHARWTVLKRACAGPLTAAPAHVQSNH